MFALVPKHFRGDVAAEQEYIAKFQRLLEYLNKLREKDDSKDTTLGVKIVSSRDKQPAAETDPVSSTPGIARNSMRRFYVQLRKGKRDPLEWMEVVIDSTFDTTWSYRIMLHWLVASSGKVDAQIQLLQRRCTQYGLNLIPFPQITVSRNVFLNPFKSPSFFTVRDPAQARRLDAILDDLDFIHDGVFATDARTILECIEPESDDDDDDTYNDNDDHRDDGVLFDLGHRRWSNTVLGRQFVHRSGTLFVRLLTDAMGRMIVISIGNYLYTSRDKKQKPIGTQVFQELSRCIEALLAEPTT